MPNYCSPTLAFTFVVNINQNTGNIIFLHYGEQQEVNLGTEFISNIFNIELRHRTGDYVELQGLDYSFIIELL